jgi:SET domain-containing protein
MFRVTNNTDVSSKMDYKAWRLFAISDIKEGEELTLTYTFYKI